jgi:hypothetical protein
LMTQPAQTITRGPVTGERPEPVLLIMADISGYTRYMTANAKTLGHSQVIITELMKSIVGGIEWPLEVSKLEGDAVFFHARKLGTGRPWEEAKLSIGAKLLNFFKIFREKTAELGRSTTCTCDACTHIEKLRLKLIVHSGEALFHQVLDFKELAGVDVILVHRLLKNSVDADQYLLMTEQGKADIAFPEELKLDAGSENYDGFGSVKTLVYLPEGQPDVPAKIEAFSTRFAQSWELSTKLLFSPLRSPSDGRLIYRHIESPAGSGRKAGLAAVTLMFAPLFLMTGGISALLHSLKAQPGGGHRQGSAHNAGCSSESGHH